MTTPQAAAQRVAQRSAYAAKQAQAAGARRHREHVVVHRRRRHPLRAVRKPAAARRWPQSLEVPLLGQIPLVPSLRQAGDDGVPVRVADPVG